MYCLIRAETMERRANYYNPGEYPHDGVFLFEDGEIAVVYGGIVSLSRIPKEAIESGDASSEGRGGARGVSEGTLLRALAIVQRPDLAQRLLDGEGGSV